LEAFAKFGSDLDKATQRTLAKGERLVELLKQGQYAPLPVEKQIVSVFIGTNDYLETIEVKDIKRFEKEFHEYVELKYPQIYENIRSTKELKEDTVELLKKAADEFLQKFNKS
jgi:F-type H+-transporting ATPase subunit alpha